jgi:hypothetical protein
VLQITAVRTQAEVVKTTVAHLRNELNSQATTGTADVQSQHTQLFGSRQHRTDSGAGTAHTRSIVAAVSDAIRGYTAQPQVTNTWINHLFLIFSFPCALAHSRFARM